MSNEMMQMIAKVNDQLIGIFKEDCDNFIGKPSELTDDEATMLIHVMANVVPARLYNKLTGDDVDILEFNHNANRLIMQFANMPDDTE